MYVLERQNRWVLLRRPTGPFHLKNIGEFFLKWNEVKVAQSYPTFCNPMDCPWDSLGQNSEVGSLSLLQGIVPIQGLNPGLLHCRQILYQLGHKGSPRILEWVAYPFSRGSSDSGIEPVSPALQVDSLPTELSGNPEFFLGWLYYPLV